jgi:hypothetical protein
MDISSFFDSLMQFGAKRILGGILMLVLAIALVLISQKN